MLYEGINTNNGQYARTINLLTISHRLADVPILNSQVEFSQNLSCDPVLF